MGYKARVTPKSGDGGVDVVAHMDPGISTADRESPV
ncbi:restriction endonuclease [Planktomarina temperata]|nr:restriction endonuclease [Planktomarina temperata]